jgi:hypothetical protein
MQRGLKKLVRYWFSSLETCNVNDKLCIHAKVNFENLKVKNYLGCISDSNGWGLVDCMHIDVVLLTKLNMKFKRWHSYTLNCDKVELITKVRYWNLLLCDRNWRRVSIFLNLQKVIDGGGCGNLTTMLVDFMATS